MNSFLFSCFNNSYFYDFLYKLRCEKNSKSWWNREFSLIINTKCMIYRKIAKQTSLESLSRLQEYYKRAGDNLEVLCSFELFSVQKVRFLPFYYRSF